MVSFESFRELALSLPEVSEEPHFEKISFRVRKKIFATYDAESKRACLKLPLVDQDVFTLASKEAIYPVNNKWGKQGWTIIELQKVRRALFEEALLKAYRSVAPPSPGAQAKPSFR